jgi:hypothetical protein
MISVCKIGDRKISDRRYRRITFVYKRASRLPLAALRCPLSGQSGAANEVLFGSRGFSLLPPLDRLTTCAQDRSYTNDVPGG